MHDLKSAIAGVTSTVQDGFERQANQALIPHLLDTVQTIEVKSMLSQNGVKRGLKNFDKKIDSYSSRISKLEQRVATQGNMLEKAMAAIEAQQQLIHTLQTATQKNHEEQISTLRTEHANLHQFFKGVVRRIAFVDDDQASKMETSDEAPPDVSQALSLVTPEPLPGHQGTAYHHADIDIPMAEANSSGTVEPSSDMLLSTATSAPSRDAPEQVAVIVESKRSAGVSPTPMPIVEDPVPAAERTVPEAPRNVTLPETPTPVTRPDTPSNATLPETPTVVTHPDTPSNVTVSATAGNITVVDQNLTSSGDSGVAVHSEDK